MSMLTDVYQEYLERERALKAALSAAEERERKLLASLADPATVHTNILRGTIALTKAQAIHIAGLPADIEERERVMRDVVTRVKNSMEVIPWAARPASWDCYIKEFAAALATPAPAQPAKRVIHESE